MIRLEEKKQKRFSINWFIILKEWLQMIESCYLQFFFHLCKTDEFLLYLCFLIFYLIQSLNLYLM